MAKIKQFTEADGALNGYKVKIDEVDGNFIYLLQDKDGQKMEVGKEFKEKTYKTEDEALDTATKDLKQQLGITDDKTSTNNSDNETSDDTTTDETVTESVFDKLFNKIISENNLVNEWDQFIQDAQPEELEGAPVVSAYDEGPYNVEDIMSDIDACETEEEQNEIIDGVKANHPELFEELIGALQAAADGANNADGEADADAAYYQSLANYAISIR